MSWNWGVFLKSWLFAFLGFLIGVVSIVIYLAVDVDLIKLYGLQILTAVLIVITIWYAYSTHMMLEEQRKSRKAADIEKQLEKLYYPLMDILKNSRVNSYAWNDDDIYYIDLKKIDEIIPFQHLALNDSRDKIEKFIDKSLEGRTIGEDGIDGAYFDIIDESFRDLVKADIKRLKEELQLI